MILQQCNWLPITYAIYDLFGIREVRNGHNALCIFVLEDGLTAVKGVTESAK